LTTTTNTYLQINAVEPYGWSETIQTRMPFTPASQEIEAPVTEKMGGKKIPSGVPAGTKIPLSKCSQASPYGNNSFPCSNAFDKSGNKFTHTNKGVGMWWRASFG
jgi:hypothetical protein